MFAITTKCNAAKARLLFSLICNNFLGTSCNQAELNAFIHLNVLISTLKNVSFPESDEDLLSKNRSI